MNRNLICKLLALFVLASAVKVSAQGTAFTYQGRLIDNGSPATNSYDLRFALFDAPVTGNAIGLPQTNLAVAVASGIFTTTIDFGPVFTGTNYWLSIGVRTNGSTNAFTILLPRQPLLPVPYAIFANTASNLLGTLPSGQLSGTYGGAVNFTNATNAFVGKFTGAGSNLTSLSASQLTFGTVADARLSTNVALLNTNQTFTGTNIFTGPNFFTGTNSFSNAANIFVGSFTGNGGNLTNLNGSAVAFGTVADARLSGNVAMLSSNLTFNGTNTFNGPNVFTGNNKFTGPGLYTGINSFTNRNNAFTGSFFGNGLVGWIPVFGTSTQAVPDAGYLMLNTKLSTVTLPSSVLTGDIVRISGGNAGGWLAAVNAGQSIIGNLASFRNAYPIIAPSSGDYSDIAMTADGVRMFAVGNFNGVFASTDSGRDFSQIGIISGHWNSVACSANGKIVYIAPSGSGVIQKSTDGFLTWSAASGSGTWLGISCSADGSKLFANNVACSGDGTNLAAIIGGNISVSTDAGANYTTIPGPVAGVTCLAVSSDCTKLVAGVNGGLLYASANMGATWTTLTSTNQLWTGAGMTPDGSKFAGSVSGATIGGIFYYGVDPRPDTVSTNTIGGSRGSAVELQFLGNGQFIPVSSSGLIWAN